MACCYGFWSIAVTSTACRVVSARIENYVIGMKIFSVWQFFCLFIPGNSGHDAHVNGIYHWFFGMSLLLLPGIWQTPVAELQFFLN